MQEFFGDFVVMDPQHFCIPIARTHVALQPFNWNYADATEAVARMTEGLASLTLSMRRRFSIRQAMLLPQSAAVGCQSGYLLGGIKASYSMHAARFARGRQNRLPELSMLQDSCFPACCACQPRQRGLERRCPGRQASYLQHWALSGHGAGPAPCLGGVRLAVCARCAHRF